MGRRLITVFELVITMTLFSMFAALIITSTTNDAIQENTSEFVDLVRYKGCITDEMYYEFLEGFDTPVDVSFVVMKREDGAVPAVTEFTGDVIAAISNPARDGIYRMNVGDEIEVFVRKASGSLYDSVLTTVGGNPLSTDRDVAAADGGRILNTQYAEE